MVGRVSSVVRRESAALRAEAQVGAAVGDVIDGRYLLVRRAGSGSCGTVWVAQDLVRGIDVAVKLLRASSGDVLRGHFAREAELASRMFSPHIVRVLARGATADEGPYVVYEHLEGEDLGTRLARVGRLAIVDVRAVLVEASRALTRAHSLGVLHRDVKPSNLFLAVGADGKWGLKMLDFGLAEIVGSDEARAVTGTLEYLAPEVLFGDSAPDARSDLYALAVVAYECVTGRVPYPAASIEELVVGYASGGPPRPSALRPGLPTEIDEWFERALCREPDGRFASAKEMAEAFEAAIEAFDRAPAISPVRVGAA
jgi:eukaryotic-like serine/threonine-protein kinase